MTIETKLSLIIAGPCAVESERQVLGIARQLMDIPEVSAMRACHRKPRTKPGFEGLGAEAIPWLREIASWGMPIAAEVLEPDDVTELVDGICPHDSTAHLIMWLGARNQNHLIQQKIARQIAQHAPPSTMLMIKNPPWPDEEHWIGAVEHAVTGGMPPQRILLCHRGFHPHPNLPNPNHFRNLPDFEMAMAVKERTGLPMLLDPSHIGGTRENVLLTIKKSRGYGFDGYVIETHQNPATALTDSRQQLSIPELKQAIQLINATPHISPEESIDAAREAISAINTQLVNLLIERARQAQAVGAAKQTLGRPVYDPERETAVLSSMLELAKTGGLPAESTSTIINAIIAQAKEVQAPSAQQL